MIISEMHYEFKLTFNSIDSQIKKDFRSNEIDSFLNNAITTFYLQFFTFNKEYQTGFENGTKNIEAFAPLVYEYPIQPLIIPTAVGGDVYEVRYESLVTPPAFITKVEIIANKTNCPSKKIEGKYKTQDTLNDRFTLPSFEWKRAPFRISKGITKSIYLYTEGDFTISGVYVSYLKKPNIIFYGGYNHINGIYTTLTSPVDCDIDEKFHKDIINIAVNIAKQTLKQ